MHATQSQEACALMHPLQGVSFLSTPLQGGILKPPALRVVADLANAASAWGSQKVISMVRYRSMAVASAVRACCRWPVLA